VLVLDTNILVKILTDEDDDVATTLLRWLRHAVNDAKCDVSGRTVTLVVSMKTLNDYVTGFSRRTVNRPGLGTAVRVFFKGYVAGRIRVTCQNGCFFASTMIIQGSSSLRIPKQLRFDKYDISYVAVLDAALKIRRLSDRGILFCCDDFKTRINVQDYATLRGQDRVKCADMSGIARIFADP
jgi:hypothetical protein